MPSVIVATKSDAMQRLFSRYFEREGGYEVTTVDTWPEAEKVADNHAVLVLQVRGPDECQRAEATYADVPHILLSGYRSGTHGMTGPNLFPMPCDLMALLARVNELAVKEG